MAGRVRHGDGRALRGWAPRWVYLDAGGAPITDLAVIARRLRAGWEDGLTEVDVEAEAGRIGRQLAAYTERLDRSERLLLPRRKQRALAEMERLLHIYVQVGEERLAAACRRLLDDVFSAQRRGGGVDWRMLADAWLHAIRDTWLQALKERRGNRPVRLRDLRPRLRDNPPPAEVLEKILALPLHIPPPSERAVVTILALPENRGRGGKENVKREMEDVRREIRSS